MRRSHIWIFAVILPALALCACNDPPRREPPQTGGLARRPASASPPPYTADSPWNLLIGPNPTVDADSATYVNHLEGTLGCDPHRYTFPVYDNVTADTLVRRINVSGIFSNVTDRGKGIAVLRDCTVEVPVPTGAMPSLGTDAQIIIIDLQTGDEWGFWRFERTLDRGIVAQNGYRYNIRWNGVPPVGFVSRGAGVPYAAGLIRPAELEAGTIRHALAFGCRDPSDLFVFPATKSDGKATFPALPEGARLQLDPSLTSTDFEHWGLDAAGKAIARALQDYGMILVDGSGHPKIYVEAEHTAHWAGALSADAVAPIPCSAFRVLSLTAPARPDAPTNLQVSRTDGHIALSWRASPEASRYRVPRFRDAGDESAVVLDNWVTTTDYQDFEAPAEGPCKYTVVAVSHNGISESATAAVSW